MCAMPSPTKLTADVYSHPIVATQHCLHINFDKAQSCIKLIKLHSHCDLLPVACCLAQCTKAHATLYPHLNTWAHISAALPHQSQKGAKSGAGPALWEQ
mmetsp:Transcript_27043/g.45940  ORF Transcript_27043/g.45940 Transcript_27043/m.45940 type:complete len:99 (+) Transcript_27043:103-399(+)